MHFPADLARLAPLALACPRKAVTAGRPEAAWIRAPSAVWGPHPAHPRVASGRLDRGLGGGRGPRAWRPRGQGGSGRQSRTPGLPSSWGCQGLSASSPWAARGASTGRGTPCWTGRWPSSSCAGTAPSSGTGCCGRAAPRPRWPIRASARCTEVGELGARPPTLAWIEGPALKEALPGLDPGARLTCSSRPARRSTPPISRAWSTSTSSPETCC